MSTYTASSSPPSRSECDGVEVPASGRAWAAASTRNPPAPISSICDSQNSRRGAPLGSQASTPMYLVAGSNGTTATRRHPAVAKACPSAPTTAA